MRGTTESNNNGSPTRCDAKGHPMNDYKAKIGKIIGRYYDDKISADEATASLLQLLTDARIEELEQIDAYPARTIWMPDLNKPSEEIKWVAAEDIKGYQQNRLAELKGEK